MHVFVFFLRLFSVKSFHFRIASKTGKLLLYICSDCLTKRKQSLTGTNLEILTAFNGPPYQNKGILKTFNTTGQLHAVNQPVLVLGGEYGNRNFFLVVHLFYLFVDGVPLPCQQMIVDNLPNSTPLMVIERGSHITMADAFPRTFDVVNNFVTKHSNSK